MPDTLTANSLDGRPHTRGTDVYAARTAYWPPMVWRSVIAGTVTALSIQLVLTLIGAGVGAALAHPSSDPNGHHVAMSAVIWLLCSGLFSFGIGGYVAGVTSGAIHSGGGAVHGVLSWALAAVLGVVLATVAGSTALGGAAAGAGAASDRYLNEKGVLVTRDTSAGLIANNGELRMSDGTVMTEADARAAAERAAQFAARVSLWTGFAFLLSAAAAGVGGALGRLEHGTFFPTGVPQEIPTSPITV